MKFEGELLLTCGSRLVTCAIPPRIVKMMVVMAALKLLDDEETDRYRGRRAAHCIGELMQWMPGSEALPARTIRGYVKTFRARVAKELGFEVAVPELIIGGKGYQLGDVKVVGIDLHEIIDRLQLRATK